MLPNCHRRKSVTRGKTALGSAVVWLLGVLFDPGSTALAEGAAGPGEASSADVAAEEAVDGSSTTSGESDKGFTLYERLMVIGSPSNVAEIPGSAHYLGLEELEGQNASDIHRVLRRIPGVNIQEEEGYGLRPNIGLRGTGVERSQKITLLEDGVLIAPAPYTAPAAYYFPTVGRMEGVEVRKGSSSIEQGPYTNGGVLNLVSSSIPDGLGGRVNLGFGEDGTLRLHGLVGDTEERYGWLLESYRLETDGFKSLDTGGDTKTELQDYLAKLRVNSADRASRHQTLELKLGKTEQEGNETYLGLTDADFSRTPLRRYAASEKDTITTDHEQVQLRYFAVLSDTLDVTATVYNNDFFRNWYKNESTRGTSNRLILDDPQSFPDEIAILRGETESDPGDLLLRNNRRSYHSRGLQTVLGLRAGGAGVTHELELGLRYHEDEEDRFQDEDGYQMVDGSLVLSFLGEPGSQTNRLSDAEATALFVQDRIRLGRFTLMPGVRYESIDYRRLDFSTADPGRSLGPIRVSENHVSVVIPGVGVAYEMTPRAQLFGGIHRGFSPPGPGAHEETEEEKSLNYEVGYRHQRGRSRAEVLAFFNDYDNLLGTETVSGGGTSSGDLFNGGEVKVRGLEASLSHDFSPPSSRWSVPLRFAYTYTSAEFQSSFETNFADWRPSVEKGDRLPYIPEHQLFVSVGVVGSSWGVHLNGHYQGAMRTSAGQGPIPEGEGTDARWVVDVGGDYQVVGNVRLFAQLRNATDEVYIVSRRPYGARPGLPRTLMAGVAFRF